MRRVCQFRHFGAVVNIKYGPRELSIAGNEEQQRISQAQQGDINAFNEIVLNYQDRIYSITYRIMGEAESAADMTQDTMLTAYRKLDTYRGGNFASWLSRIATNTCYDELRRRKRRPVTYLEDLNDPESDDAPPIPSDADTPEEVAQQYELQQVIENCIKVLKEDQRLVIILSDVQGMAYAEVAEQLGVKIGTVKSRLSRARVAVRNCLQDFQELLPDEFRLGL